MGSCHAKSLVGTCQCAQHLRPFLYVKTLLSEILQFYIVAGNGRSVYHQALLGIFARLGYQRQILSVVDAHALLTELTGELCFGFVIACHHQSLVHKIAGDGTHANAAGTQKIYCFYFV